MKNIFICLFSILCFAQCSAQSQPTVVNLNQQAIVRPNRANMITVLQNGLAKRMNQGEFEDSLKVKFKNDSFANVFGNLERVGQTRFGIGLNTIFSKIYQFGQNPMEDNNVWGTKNIKVLGVGSNANYMSSVRNVVTAGGVRKRNDFSMFTNVDYPKIMSSFANDTGLIMRTTLSNSEGFFLGKNSKGSIVFTETNINNVIKQTGLQFSDKMPTIPTGSNFELQIGAIFSVKDSQRIFVNTDAGLKKVAYLSDITQLNDYLTGKLIKARALKHGDVTTYSNDNAPIADSINQTWVQKNLKGFIIYYANNNLLWEQHETIIYENGGALAIDNISENELKETLISEYGVNMNSQLIQLLLKSKEQFISNIDTYSNDTVIDVSSLLHKLFSFSVEYGVRPASDFQGINTVQLLIENHSQYSLFQPFELSIFQNSLGEWGLNNENLNDLNGSRFYLQSVFRIFSKIIDKSKNDFLFNTYKLNSINKLKIKQSVGSFFDYLASSLG
jgi:hypothetical protein